MGEGRSAEAIKVAKSPLAPPACGAPLRTAEAASRPKRSRSRGVSPGRASNLKSAGVECKGGSPQIYVAIP
jgi:hypothetical protein